MKIYSQTVSGYTIHAQYQRTDDSHTYYKYWLTGADNNAIITTYGGIPRHSNYANKVLIHGLFCATNKSADDDMPNAWLDSYACEELACDQNTIENEYCCRCSKALVWCDSWDYDHIDECLYVCGGCKS